MSLDDKKFFDLCYDQYKVEDAEVAAIYQRSTLLVTIIAGLATATVTLARVDWLGHWCRVDIALYYFSLASAAACLGVAGFRTYFALRPVSGYQGLKSVGELWAERCAIEELARDKENYVRIIKLLTTAHKHNQRLNERRRQHTQSATTWIGRALLSLAISGVMRFIVLAVGV